MPDLTFTVASANICANPERPQPHVVTRIGQAYAAGAVTFFQELSPSRYKSALVAAAKRLDRNAYGLAQEVPIVLDNDDWHVVASKVARVHGGLAHVSPSRYYTTVETMHRKSGAKVAFVAVHTVSKGYYLTINKKTTSAAWRHARLLDYWKALGNETTRLHRAGYTVIVGGDCNWPNPPKPHPDAQVLVQSGLDHLWVIPADGWHVTATPKVIPAALKELGMDHPIIAATVRLTTTAPGKHAAPAPAKETPAMKAPAPTYVGPPKWHGAANNKPIHRYVIHATVGAEPGVKGAARAQVRATNASARKTGYHYISDANETLQLTYDSTVAFHAPPNTHSLGHELCCSLTNKGEGHWANADHQRMLHRVAVNCAQACLFYDIPIVKLSAADLRAGKRGICGHIDVTNAWHETSHWDPGPYFPWADFMRMVHEAADAIKGAHTAEPTPPADVHGEPTRIEWFRDNYHATHQLDMSALDKAVSEQHRTGTVKAVRDEIDHLMRTLPHDKDASAVNEVHAYYDLHRVVKMGLLSDAVKAGRAGHVKAVRDALIQQVDRLPAA